MSAAGVVEPFDVFEHRIRQLDTAVPAPPVQQFDLHAAPEGLDDGVIVGITNSAQGWQEPCLLGAPGECPRGELGAVVPMDNCLSLGFLLTSSEK